MELNFEKLHHAYLLVGTTDKAHAFVLESFASNGEVLVGLPDFFIYRDKTFGIDEARALSNTSSRKAFGKRKVFFLAPEKITLEAQNALLKTFEEPTPDTHFFLTVTDANVVIPTLLSRVLVVELNSTKRSDEAEKFLKLNVKDRLNFVKKFIDQEKNLSIFLDSLILTLKENKMREELEKVYKMRLVSDERGTSPRLILEHLALVL